jgi:hypothetical protein
MWKPELWENYAISADAMGAVRAVHMLVTTFFLILGEAAALWALTHDPPVTFGWGDPAWLVASGLMVGSLSLIAQVSVQAALEMKNDDASRRATLKGRVELRSMLAIICLASMAFVAYVVWAILSGLSR